MRRHAMESITTTTVKPTISNGSSAIRFCGVIVMAIYGLVVVTELTNHCWILPIAECEVSRIGCG
ncbi:Uncharacterised protein [Shigella sonnei]|nr:Uncharacterised protein [Shigella sonnei]